MRHTELLVLLVVVQLGQIELSGALLSYLLIQYGILVHCLNGLRVVYAYSLTPLCIARVGMEL